jgi:hypothetical protein
MTDEKMTTSNDAGNIHVLSGAPRDADKIVKLGSAMLGSLYIIGLLVTNYYLFSLGISDFSVVKAKFIYTGFIAVIPASIAIFSLVAALSYFREETTPSGINPTVWSIVRYSNIGMLLLIPPILFIAGLGPRNGISFYFVSAAAGFLTLAVIQWNPAAIKATKARLAAAIVGLLFFAGYFHWYLSLCAAFLLTEVPQQFGGLRATQARMLIESNSVEPLRAMGLPLPDKSQLTQPVDIVFESETAYFVSTWSDSAPNHEISEAVTLQIAKGDVKAVQIPRPR